MAHLLHFFTCLCLLLFLNANTNVASADDDLGAQIVSNFSGIPTAEITTVDSRGLGEGETFAANVLSTIMKMVLQNIYVNAANVVQMSEDAVLSANDSYVLDPSMFIDNRPIVDNLTYDRSTPVELIDNSTTSTVGTVEPVILGHTTNVSTTATATTPSLTTYAPPMMETTVISYVMQIAAPTDFASESNSTVDVQEDVIRNETTDAVILESGSSSSVVVSTSAPTLASSSISSTQNLLSTTESPEFLETQSTVVMPDSTTLESPRSSGRLCRYHDQISTAAVEGKSLFLNFDKEMQIMNDTERIICDFVYETVCQWMNKTSRRSCDNIVLSFEFLPKHGAISFDKLQLSAGLNDEDLDLSNATEFLSERIQTLQRLLMPTVVFENTTLPSREPIAHTGLLDSTVVVTVFIATLVSVGVVGIVSLVVLVCMHCYRRRYSGQWIVNKQTKARISPKADAWYFENGAFLDDNKRPMRELAYENSNGVAPPFTTSANSCDVVAHSMSDMPSCVNGVKESQQQQHFSIPPPPPFKDAFPTAKWSNGVN